MVDLPTFILDFYGKMFRSICHDLASIIFWEEKCVFFSLSLDLFRGTFFADATMGFITMKIHPVGEYILI